MNRSDRPPLRAPAGLAGVLAALVEGQGWEQRFAEFRLWLDWDELVGAQIAAHARPLKLRDGILELAVDHPVWMQQLQLLKPALLARLRERAGDSAPADLYVRLETRRRAAAVSAPATPALPDWRHVRLDPADQALINRTLAPLPEGELKERFARLLERQLKMEKAGMRSEE